MSDQVVQNTFTRHALNIDNICINLHIFDARKRVEDLGNLRWISCVNMHDLLCLEQILHRSLRDHSPVLYDCDMVAQQFYLMQQMTTKKDGRPLVSKGAQQGTYLVHASR